MNQILPQESLKSIANFSLPRYQEIPDVGLYLEQTAKYISEYYEPLGQISLTTSMISNYVKQKMIPRPVRKQYGRDQIAYLFYIAAAKQLLSLDHIRMLFEMQTRTCPLQEAYDFFCSEFELALRQIFNLCETPPDIAGETQPEKLLLRRTVKTAASMIYLGKTFEALSEGLVD